MSNLATQEQPKNQIVTVRVLNQIERLMGKGDIVLPPDYIPQNALNAAWLWIQNSEQKDKLLACTPESQINALHDMVLQCGDVSKGTGYFIPYKDRMAYQRHYEGDAALAMRCDPTIGGITAEVVYENEVDGFVQSKMRTRYGFVTVVEKHAIKAVRGGNIALAYCCVSDVNGESMGDEVMTIDQIHTSWRKSKTFNVDTMKPRYDGQGPTFHTEQPDKACKRTVIRRRCLPIIRKSTHAWLVAAVMRQEIEETAAEMDAEIDLKANKTLITMPPIPDRVGEAMSEEGTDEDAKVVRVTTTLSQEEEEAESPAPEAPAQPVADPEPAPTTNTPEAPPPAKTGSQRLELTKTENDECKALFDTKASDKSWVLFKPACEKEGVVTYEAFRARIEALPSKAAPEGPDY